MDQFSNSKLIEVLNKLVGGNKLVQFQVDNIPKILK